jgi:hypothetical protein
MLMAAEATIPQSAAPWLTPEAIATAARILRSHQQAFGRPLIAAARTTSNRCAAGVDAAAPLLAQELFAAPVVVLAHDGRGLDQGDGPRLIYANRSALSLWQRPWAEMVGMPSKLTAEPAERASRQNALAAAQQHSAISGYSGIRIDRLGRRFQIRGARLWTLRDPAGEPCDQAACFSDWWWL